LSTPKKGSRKEITEKILEEKKEKENTKKESIEHLA